MTTYLGKSCSFCLPRVPFVNCRQFMYLVISLLVLRAGYGIWLYQFLIIAYLFTLHSDCSLIALSARTMTRCPWSTYTFRSGAFVIIWLRSATIKDPSPPPAPRGRVVKCETTKLGHTIREPAQRPAWLATDDTQLYAFTGQLHTTYTI